MIRDSYPTSHDVGQELANVGVVGQAAIDGNFISNGRTSIHRDNHFTDSECDTFQNSLCHI